MDDIKCEIRITDEDGEEREVFDTYSPTNEDVFSNDECESTTVSVDSDTQSSSSSEKSFQSQSSSKYNDPEDCPVVSANDAVAYYDVLTAGPRVRTKKARTPCPSFYHVDFNENLYGFNYDQVCLTRFIFNLK